MAEEKTFDEKIRAVQNEIGVITKDSENPFFKSKYFDINKLVETLTPLLVKNGLQVLQPLSNVDGRPAITTIVKDSKDKMEQTITLPDLTDPQKMGSCITYYRRYALQSLFFLQAEDDDANMGAGNVKKEVKMVKPPVQKPSHTFQADAENNNIPPVSPNMQLTPEEQDSENVCPDCGAGMKVSKAGRKYCEKTCWLNK